jgi:hypothetical protein
LWEIRFAGAHYLLALKANHGTLHAEVTTLFADSEALDYGRSKGNQVLHHDSGPEKSHIEST